MAHSPLKLLTISDSDFGKMPDGTDISLFTLTNENGTTIKITNFGGIITELYTADKDEQFADIVLGFDQIEPYFSNSPYFGAIIGRYANRIAKGKFTLNNQPYHLSINNGINHLHGGIKGFNKVVWEANTFINNESVGLILTYSSPDGEEGYPGNLNTSVTYQLNNNNELIVKFKAITDKATPVNLTQHSYFNLKGLNSVYHDKNLSTILNHQLEINANVFIPIDSVQIPTGAMQSVINTPFDFRLPQTIGKYINNLDEQLKNGLGYDHTFVLNKNSIKGLSLAARAVEPQSGRTLELFTDQPGVQFYSGNFLDGSLEGKGHRYIHRSGFCLEPQHFPDSPNHANFPNTILQPYEEYSSTLIYKFSVIR